MDLNLRERKNLTLVSALCLAAGAVGYWGLVGGSDRAGPTSEVTRKRALVDAGSATRPKALPRPPQPQPAEIWRKVRDPEPTKTVTRGVPRPTHMVEEKRMPYPAG